MTFLKTPSLPKRFSGHPSHLATSAPSCKVIARVFPTLAIAMLLVMTMAKIALINFFIFTLYHVEGFLSNLIDMCLIGCLLGLFFGGGGCGGRRRG